LPLKRKQKYQILRQSSKGTNLQQRIATHLLSAFSVQLAISEVQKMKAAKEQMVKQNRQACDELQMEFTETDEELKQLQLKFNSELGTVASCYVTSLTSLLLAKLVTHEEQLSSRLRDVKDEKAKYEKRCTILSEEYGKLQASINVWINPF
jgi:hypothetical protein